MAALEASSALWRPSGSHSRHVSSRHRHLPKASGGHTENPPKPKPAEVFLACVPLVGFEALGAALGDAYPSQLEHVMVLVRRFDLAENGEETSTVVCYDFLPADPLAPATAAVMLSGGEVAGNLRVRPLRGVPSRRCWKVGTYVSSEARRVPGGAESTSISSSRTDAHAAAHAFHRRYPSRLCLRPDRKNTCVEHAEALAEHLTGNTVRYEALTRTPSNTKKRRWRG